MSVPSQPPHRVRPIAEKIEQRVLYSADPAGTQVANEAAQVALANQPSSVTEQKNELVFIDTRVPQYQDIVADLTAQQLAGRAISVVLITPEQDALSQITQTLEQAQDTQFSAIHIISHGDTEQLFLGQQPLNFNSVQSRASEIAQWSNHLTDTADIRLYGCRFAASEQGVKTIHALAALTGADVAASTDDTGQSALSGNWALEVSTGAQEAGQLLTQTTQLQWANLLGNEPATVNATIRATTEDFTELGFEQTDSSVRTVENANHVTLTGYIEVSNNSQLRQNTEFSLRSANGASIAAGYLEARDAAGNIVLANANTADLTVAVLDNGNFVIAWLANTPDNRQVLAWATIDQNGTVLSTQAWEVTGEQIASLSIAGENDYKIALSYVAKVGAQSSLHVAVLDVAGTTAPYHLLQYSYAITGESGVNTSIDFLQNNTFVLALTTVTAAAGQPSHLRAFAVDISQLDKGGNAIFDNRLTYNGNSLRVWDVATNSGGTTGSGRQKEIQTAQVIGMSAGNFAVVWSEVKNGPFFLAAENVYAISLNIDLISSPITTQINSSDRWHLDAVRSVWDSVTSQLIVGWSYGGPTASGIDYRRFNDQLQAIDLAPDTSTIIAPSGEQYFLIGIGMTNGVGVLSYQVMPDMASSAPPTTNPIDFAYVSFGPGQLIVTQPPIAYTQSQYPIQVKLDRQPTHDVIVQLNSGASVTFTAANWHVAQTLFYAVDSSTSTTLVSLNYTSSDTRFNSSVSIQVNRELTPTTLVVDTTSDSSANDSGASTVAELLYNRGADNKISLREAIRALNGTPSIDFANPNTITFALSELDSKITITAALPTITGKLKIDGYVNSQTNVTLDGNGLAANGLEITSTAGGSEIAHLNIGGFGYNGISVQATGTQIHDNQIGLWTHSGVTETLANGNANIYVGSIGNVISSVQVYNNQLAASQYGVFVINTYNGIILNNQIGLIDGQGSRFGHTADGIFLTGTAASTQIADNQIGFNGFGIDNNGLPASNGSGITLDGTDVTSNNIYKNWIGTDKTRSVSAGNSRDGISIRWGSSQNTIGGATIDLQNFIENNQFNGVHIFSSQANLTQSDKNSILINTIKNNAQVRGGGAVAPGGIIYRAVELSSINPNAGIGIDAGWNSTKQQDIGDVDGGPNGLLNSLDPLDNSTSKPNWTAHQGLSGLVISGFYFGEPNTRVRVDIYSFDAAKADPDMGQWLGTFDLSVGADGKAQIGQTISAVGFDATTQKLSSVVTQISSAAGDPISYGSSSRASLGISVDQGPPLLNFAPGDVFTIAENTQVLFNLIKSPSGLNWADLDLTLDTVDTNFFSLDRSGTSPGLFFGPADYEGDVTSLGNHQYSASLSLTDSFGRRTTLSVLITVTDVQESPTLTLVQAVNRENEPIRFSNTNSLTLAEPASTNGVYNLMLRNGSDFTLSDGTLSDSTLIFSGTVAQINLQLQQLVLTAAANSYGVKYLNYELSVQSTGAQLVTGTLAFDVLQVNQPPTANPSQVTVLEGQSVTLAQTTFGLVDRETAPKDFIYVVVSLPANGVLRISGTDAIIGTQFTGADIESGQVVFWSAANSTTTQVIDFTIYDSTINGVTRLLPLSLSIAITPNPIYGPVLTLSELSTVIDENSAIPQLFSFSGTGTLTLLSLSGADAALFSVGQTYNTTGFLALNLPLDFETSFSAAGNKTFSITISVRDSAGRITAQNYNVTLRDLNEASSIKIVAESNPNTIAEDSSFQLNGVQAPIIQLLDPDISPVFRSVSLTIELFNASFGSGYSGTPTYNTANASWSLVVNSSVESLSAMLASMVFVPTPNYSGNVNIALTVVDPAKPVALTKVVSVSVSPIPDPLVLNAFQFSVLQGDIYPLSDPNAFSSTVDSDPSLLALKLTATIGQGRLIWIGDSPLAGQEIKIGGIFTYGDLIGGRIGYENTRFDSPNDQIFLSSIDASANIHSSAVLTAVIDPNPKIGPAFVNLGNTRIDEGQNGIWNFQVITDRAIGLDSITLAGQDADRFSIQFDALGNASLTFNRAANFEAFEANDRTNTFAVLVFATDKAGRQIEQRVEVTVQDINEAASLNGTAGAGSPEDGVITFSAVGSRQLNLVDQDLTASLQSVQLSLTNGTVTLPTLAGLTISNVTGSAEAATQWTVSGNTELLKSYLANLSIKPNANFFGTVGLDLTITDLAVKNPGPAATLHIDLTVDSINDLPTLTVQAGNLNEGASVVITASQLRSSDIEDAAGSLMFELTFAPTIGDLMLSGQVLASGARFSQAQLDAGLVTYKHRAAGAGVERLNIVAVDSNSGRSVDQTLELNVNRAVVTQTTTAPSTQAPPTTPILIDNNTNYIQSGGADVANVNPSNAAIGSEGTTTTNKPAASKAPAQGPAPVNLAAAPSAVANIHQELTSGVSSMVSSNSDRANSNATSERRPVSMFEDQRRTAESLSNRGSLAMPEGQRIQLEKARDSMATKAFQSDLKQMRDEVNQGIKLERTVVTSTVAVSTGVSIGYVIWLLRGGVLLSSLLASVPAWRSFDPLPILASTNKSDKDVEDDSLENLLKKARKKLSLNKQPADEVASQT